MKRRRAREYALQMLFQLDLSQCPLTSEFIKDFWADKKEESDVKDFANNLVEGTWKNLDKIDELIKKSAEHWSLKRMAAVDRSILRFATYEILYRSDIPSSVAINEAIEIAKKYSTLDSAPFINGILDRISKSQEATKVKKM
ncbi:MAG TPA: transcription antitermination factor NusB [Nitrospiraceae bacterium]|nr:transcription antitermination factor NusB [Nitrospiraceae bacterium]